MTRRADENGLTMADEWANSRAIVEFVCASSEFTVSWIAMNG